MFRRGVSDALAVDPALEVVGSASSSSTALARIEQKAPDLVILDLEMPGSDGLSTLAAMRTRFPRVRVLLLCPSGTEHEARAVQGLAQGAADYVAKPSERTSDRIRDAVRERLLQKVRALCPQTARRHELSAPPTSAKVTLREAARHRVDIVAIGVSTGGPDALTEVLPALPAEFPVPIVVVQHMPPTFTSALAARLDKKCKLRVHEGRQGAVVEPGHIWIAPGDRHMTLQRQGTTLTLDLNQDAPENSCRPAVDPLLRSVVHIFGKRALGVIMTGMGQDGLRGCEHLAAAGGRILVQDEASSIVWGMPGFVANAGLAEKVLPLRTLAVEIVRLANQGRIDDREAGAG